MSKKSHNSLEAPYIGQFCKNESFTNLNKTEDFQSEFEKSQLIYSVSNFCLFATRDLPKRQKRSPIKSLYLPRISQNASPKNITDLINEQKYVFFNARRSLNEKRRYEHKNNEIGHFYRKSEALENQIKNSDLPNKNSKNESVRSSSMYFNKVLFKIEQRK